MKKKIKYSDRKIGKVEIVNDLLPKPEELVFKDDVVKVMLNLSKSINNKIEILKDIKLAEVQIRTGKGVTHKDVKKKYRRNSNVIASESTHLHF